MSQTTPASPEELAAAIEAGGSRKPFWLGLFFFLILLVGGAGGWFWWNQKKQAENQKPAFVTEALKKGDISLTITATGNLEPTNKVTVGSELSGSTLEVYVDINDHVTKGQPLAKLDTTKLTQQNAINRAALDSAKAKVTQAEASLKENEATLARQQELHRLSGGKVPSQAEMAAAIATSDRAKADLVSAKAAVGEAEAQIRINENDLSKAVIKSPIDGIVLTRNVEPGQTVAASFTAPELFVIAENLERMILKVAIAEADIGRVAKDQKSTFTVDAWADRAYSANVTRVSFGSAVVSNVVTYQTELEVTNSDLSLRPGMTATADIRVAESKDVLVVPNAALRFNPNAAAADPAAAGAAKKSFVQNLIPSPGRGSSGNRPPRVTSTDKGSGHGGRARIWILRDGAPVELKVKLGLSDGRFTEISGEGVTEGLPVILRANPAAS